MNTQVLRKLYKVVVIGQKNTGKTSIVKRYKDGVFNPRYMETIGVDFSIKKILDESANEEKQIQFWDVAGNEIHGSLTSHYFKDANAIIVVMDSEETHIMLNNWTNTFELMQKFTNHSSKEWLDDVLNKVPNIRDMPILMLFNKDDLVNKKPIDIDYFTNMVKSTLYGKWLGHSVSAKNGLNIDRAMSELISKMDELGSYKITKISTKINKLCFIGDNKVGKSSLIKRYSTGTHDEFYRETIGMNKTLVQAQNDEDILNETILIDVSGGELCGNMTHLYFLDVTALFLVADYTNEQSISNLIKWYFLFQTLGPGSIPYKVLINKTDEKSSYVCTKAISDLSKTIGVKNIEYVSAKDDNRASELKTIINSVF